MSQPLVDARGRLSGGETTSESCKAGPIGGSEGCCSRSSRSADLAKRCGGGLVPERCDCFGCAALVGENPLGDVGSGFVVCRGCDSFELLIPAISRCSKA